jgi:hypothetical protein
VEVQSYPAKSGSASSFLLLAARPKEGKAKRTAEPAFACNSGTLARGRPVFAKEEAWQPLLSAAVLAVEFNRNV